MCFAFCDVVQHYWIFGPLCTLPLYFYKLTIIAVLPSAPRYLKGGPPPFPPKIFDQKSVCTFEISDSSFYKLTIIAVLPSAPRYLKGGPHPFPPKIFDQKSVCTFEISDSSFYKLTIIAVLPSTPRYLKGPPPPFLPRFSTKVGMYF